jgi:peptide/nickel transport system permease protein
VQLLMKNPTPEKVAEARARLLLDRPLPVQYLAFMRHLVVHGSFGRSIVTTREVSDDLARMWAATAELAVAAMTLGLIAGLALGVWMAARRGTWPDLAGNVCSLLGLSVPVFWLGLVLMLMFSLKLGLLPPGDRLSSDTDFQPLTGLLLLDSLVTGRLDVFADALAHLVLPAITLATIPAAFIARVTRTAVVEALQQDFVRTARAKGLRERVVILKHAMRNALIPLITIVVFQIPGIFGGATITETVFNWPGMGFLYVYALAANDYPVAMAFLFISAVLVVIASLLGDILYTVVDPRIRFS